MDIAALQQTFPTAEFSAGEGELTRMTLRADGGWAEVYLHGAHVTHFQPDGEEPVIWMSGCSRFETGAPIRGGVPVCFPWFGSHPNEPDLPSHGLVRQQPWNVRSVAELEDGAVRAELEINSTHETLEVWPHSFNLVLTVTVCEQLTLALQVRNPADTPFTYTEALHTYYAVSDIRTVELHGLDGTEYVDKLLETESTMNQCGPVRFTAETDRPYLDTTSDCLIEDIDLNRLIRIRKRGSNTTVVWNPWVSKARRMEDFCDDEWPAMLCVETANVLRNAVSLAGGHTHTMETIISIERLEASGTP